jgi:hypothetical protein
VDPLPRRRRIALLKFSARQKHLGAETIRTIAGRAEVAQHLGVAVSA